MLGNKQKDWNGINNVDTIYSKTLLYGKRSPMFPRKLRQIVKDKLHSYVSIENEAYLDIRPLIKNIEFDLGIAFTPSRADIICDYCKELITIEGAVYRGIDGNMNQDRYYSFMKQYPSVGYDFVFNKSKKSDRWEKLSKYYDLESVDWKQDGEAIVLPLNSPFDYLVKLRFSNKQYLLWVMEIIEKIRSITDRKIIIRPHPETNAQFLVKLDQLSSRFSEVVLSNTSLNRILDEAYCCVVFGSSTTGVASIFKGVPIISLNNTNVYKNVTNTLENIENLNYNIDLTDWRNTLGYSMWHISEFESGEAWDYILK